MQNLTLQDFEFAMDHNYYLGDYILKPVFGGFIIFYKDKQAIKHPVGEAAAIAMIKDHAQGLEVLSDDDMRFDCEMEKEYQSVEEL
jgi:hypothetical protein